MPSQIYDIVMAPKPVRATSNWSNCETLENSLPINGLLELLC